ncbi:MAG: hypothetical protein K0S07_1027 [Chlamydiales bacterium]|nr:hypothetical protein [Chlamydiales bacterium]
MLKSMTAFGRATKVFSWGCLTLELQSVNRKHLDIALRLPSELQLFDTEIRRWLQEHVKRGYITLTARLSVTAETNLPIEANLPYARQLKKALSLISEAVDLPLTPDAFWQVVARQEQALFIEKADHTEDDLRAAIKEVFDAAFAPFLESKLSEGHSIYADINERLFHVSQVIEEIAGLSFSATDVYRKKLIERLKAFSPSETDLDERLLKEIALFAEKVDIAEEVTRFCHHLHRFEELLKETEAKRGNSKGKVFDFLLQELGREVNTIGSKACDYAISSRVVEIKGELERIREQIQNVE